MAEVSLYTPRQMLRAMQERVSPDFFLQSQTISGPPQISDKKYIELDKVLGKQGISVYNTRTGESVEVSKSGFTSDIHEAPYIDEQITMTPADFDTRDPGETIYDSVLSSNLANRTALYLDELNSRVDRLQEKQCFQILKEGKVSVTNTATGVNYTVDYLMPAANKITLTGDDVWGGTDSAILPNLETWAGQLSDQGYVAASLYLDVKAAARYRADTEIRALLDNRRINIGEMEIKKYQNQRASWLGTLDAIGLNINVYAYFGGYKTDNSTFVRYMDDNRAILVGAGLEMEQHYGKIENFKTNFKATRFPNMWSDNKGKEKYIGMESSPLVVLRNPNAIVSAKVGA